jgi:putative transposase
MADTVVMNTRKPYPSDVTDAQWDIMAPYLDIRHRYGAPPKWPRRELYNAVRYVLRAGCAWDMLPHDFPPRTTVHDMFMVWESSGALQRAQEALAEQVRVQEGRTAAPSLVIVDSQSVKMADQGGERGLDAGKKVNGRKRFCAVDSLGIVVGVLVVAANVSESAGAKMLLERMYQDRPERERPKAFLADTAYRGMDAWSQATLGLPFQTSGKPEGRKGFVPVRKRWVVERTFAHLGKFRRNARDYEVHTTSSEAMLRLASLDHLLNRLRPRMAAA